MLWAFLIEYFGKFRDDAAPYVRVVEPAQLGNPSQQEHHHLDHLLLVGQDRRLAHQVIEQVATDCSLLLQRYFEPILGKNLLESRCRQELRVLVARVLDEVLQLWQILDVVVVSLQFLACFLVALQMQKRIRVWGLDSNLGLAARAGETKSASTQLTICGFMFGTYFPALG